MNMFANNQDVVPGFSYFVLNYVLIFYADRIQIDFIVTDQIIIKVISWAIYVKTLFSQISESAVLIKLKLLSSI